MATLPLTPLALVSTQRTVPSNGSPSSQDYNDDQNDGLIDLTSLVSFINGTLIPLLQVLPSLAAAAGLEGRAINTDSTNLTALCFNALTSTPLDDCPVAQLSAKPADELAESDHRPQHTGRGSVIATVVHQSDDSPWRCRISNRC